jgi:eukaryotic-like serine/threonine-protein kinase
VWAAHNVPLESAVAIKLFRADGNRHDLELRLLQEARAAARLGHPAIVRVFDIGKTEQGDPFIVMELLEGESLGARLHREWRMSSIDAVKLLLPIADALRAAHAKGIVHRDIKPDNVFLAAGEGISQPKLVDFGIAKLEQRELATHQTERGVVVGSPDYMSPEQARGEDDIDYRSDIWSFCVVLYQAVTGASPFTGPNYNALLRSIVEDQPASFAERAAGDAELWKLVEVGLAKDRLARWRSIGELGVALAAWLARHGVFEDAAGHSLDARWLNRQSDAGRQSRASFASLSDPTPESGLAATKPPSHSLPSAHAPTSLAPQNIHARRFRTLSWRVLALGIVALCVGMLLLLRAPTAREPAAPHGQAAPAAAPPADPKPVSVPAPVLEAPAKPLEAALPSPPPSARRPRDRAKKAAPSARPEAGPKLDLMAPY